MGKKTRKIFGTSFGKKLPSIISMFIVYFLVSFWHGSSYKYIAYGLWNGIFIMSGILFAELYEKARNLLGFSEQTSAHRVFQMIRTSFIISFGRYFSSAATFKDTIRFYKHTFINCTDFSFLFNGTLKKAGLDTGNWILLLLTLLILFLVDYLHEKGYHLRTEISKQHPVYRWMIYTTVILAILIFGIYGPGYDAASFIYEQF